MKSNKYKSNVYLINKDNFKYQNILNYIFSIVKHNYKKKIVNNMFLLVNFLEIYL